MRRSVSLSQGTCFPSECLLSAQQRPCTKLAIVRLNGLLYWPAINKSVGNVTPVTRSNTLAISIRTCDSNCAGFKTLPKYWRLRLKALISFLEVLWAEIARARARVCNSWRGFYARSQNFEKRLSALSCLSVLLHGITRLSLDGLPWNLTSEYVSKICWENSSLILMWQE